MRIRFIRLILATMVVATLVGQTQTYAEEKKAPGWKNIQLKGYLFSINKETNFNILKVDKVFYKFSFKDLKKIEGIHPGDMLTLSGLQSPTRELILKDCTFKKLGDPVVMKAVIAKLCPGGWNDGLFRMITENKEFWQINFDDGEIQNGLKEEVFYTIKGVMDVHLEQTLHKAVVFDTIRPRKMALTLTEVNFDTGYCMSKDAYENFYPIDLEAPKEECEGKFKVGDKVKVIGYQNSCQPYSAFHFARFEDFGATPAEIPVDFVGEVIVTKDSKDKPYFQCRSGNLIWLVTPSSASDLKRLKHGDWVRVKGMRTSFVNRTIKGNRINITTSTIYGMVTSHNPYVPDYSMYELRTNASWQVRPADKSLPYKTGEYIKASGRPAATNKILLSASVSKLYCVEGVVTDFDLKNQTLTILTSEGKAYLACIKVDQVNLDDFNFDDNVKIVGSGGRSTDEYSQLNECFVEKKTN